MQKYKVLQTNTTKYIHKSIEKESCCTRMNFDVFPLVFRLRKKCVAQVDLIRDMHINLRDASNMVTVNTVRIAY